MIIRPASERDFPEILHVQAEAFGEYAEIYETFRKVLTS